MGRYWHSTWPMRRCTLSLCLASQAPSRLGLLRSIAERLILGLSVDRLNLPPTSVIRTFKIEVGNGCTSTGHQCVSASPESFDERSQQWSVGSLCSSRPLIHLGRKPFWPALECFPVQAEQSALVCEGPAGDALVCRGREDRSFAVRGNASPTCRSAFP